MSTTLCPALGAKRYTQLIYSANTSLTLQRQRSASKQGRDTRRRARIKTLVCLHHVVSKHIDKNAALLWGHGPMHADIISPKFCALRPNRNKSIATAYRALHEPICCTPTRRRGHPRTRETGREHAVAAGESKIHQLLLFKLRPSTRAAVDSRPRGRVDGGGGRAEGGYGAERARP